MIDKDGSIAQVERTSCGLNQGPLLAEGTYPAVIASTLTCKANSKKLVTNKPEEAALPYIYEESVDGQKAHYIATINDSVVIGYKYFDFGQVESLGLKVKGQATGILNIYQCDASTMTQPEDGKMKLAWAHKMAEVDLSLAETEWADVTIPVSVESGVYALFFQYEGEGAFALQEVLFN